MRTRSPYQQLTIRTQSPYQPPATHGRGYGGQAVGATGPDAAPVGQQPVRRSPSGDHRTAIAAATRSNTSHSAVESPPSPAQLPPPQQFGPPPMHAAAAQQYAAPPPQYAPAPQYGPPAHIRSRRRSSHPIRTSRRSRRCRRNPQLSPYRRLDPFTPMFIDPAVDLDVVLSEAQTGRLMLGVAVNSDAGLVGPNPAR